MAFNFFGGGGGPASAKIFEIRLDSSNLVLRGSEHEAASALLKGSVVLCLSEPLRIQNIHMRLSGESRVSWPIPASQTSSGKSRLERRKEFFSVPWVFKPNGVSGPQTLKPGNYEFDFEHAITGDMPESIEGLDNSWIIYRMKATIERGMLQQNIHARRHVRVIRTLEASALELAHEMSVENIWPNKIDYTIRTPVKAVIFGTSVATEFRLSPLLKGLKIGAITTRIEEVQEFTIEGISPRFNAAKNVRVIGEDTYHIPETQETEEWEGQESYHFERTIQLPRSLVACIQDVDAKGIKVRHKMKYNVQLHNPDGHTSELRATLPLTIFLSPNLPLDDSNELVERNPVVVQATADAAQVAPPMYGEHQFDQLYSDIDTSGFTTRGVNTPFMARSRNQSTENLSNLASMDALTESTVAPAELEQRLTNLQEPAQQDHPAPTSRNSHYSRSGHSSNTQTPSHALSRRHSQEDGSSGTQNSGAQTPRTLHLEADTEALSRVPSYQTAVRTPAVRTPFTDSLPDYNTAMSAPPSPSAENSNIDGVVHDQPPDSYFPSELPTRPAPVRLANGMQRTNEEFRLM
ncbi:MAG: hypothetical protein M1834_009441 [Cirrosporium novae-zelandiae]|nr:MAG: hypothetical protein M1834_009441 [Cirrosporium novae-zelandiae]